jgi:hypothetical protein
MLKYVSKFAMDILPSVAATIIGAYIVNHYINTKPGTDAPVAASLSTADPKKLDLKKLDLKAGAKPAETSSDVANLPEAGVRAKGISEKAVFEKPAFEKPQEKGQDKSQDKAQDKSADKPTETASIPVETRRHQPAPRDKDKTAIRTIPLTASPAVQPAAAPVVAAPTPAPAVEAAVTPEEHRDANDLARAAIERLRGGSDGAAHADASPRAQDPVRAPDTTHVPDAPRIASAPPVRPLPPPIMVSTSPASEPFDSTTASTQANPPYQAARSDDPRRPVPPADIPDARPLDLQAEASETPPARPHTTVAQDVLSGVKSVFHSVLPQ